MRRHERALSFSPKLRRMTTPVALLCAAVNVVVGVVEVAKSDVAAHEWLFLVCSVFSCACLTWLTVIVWRHPLVTVTRDEVVLRPYGGREQRIALSQVEALRWQDSFDLRLCMPGGEEHNIRMNGLGQPNRRRLEAALRERIGHGSVVI